MFSTKQTLLLAAFLQCAIGSPIDLEPRLANGLGITPPMGWNSYNHYSCSPTEAIIKSNAQALVSLGLQAEGYHYVTVDCGWTLPDRIANGTMTWNPALFPEGYFNLGTFLHDLGLGFGVYADAGIQTCMTGTPAQAGSLFHETVDAATFASWGADLVKYDDCYSEASAGYPDTDYTPTVSPSGRYANMTAAIAATGRPMLFAICEWGVDFPSAWAPALGNSWRISNDIIPAFRTIARILNQVAPQTSFAGPGHWLDLDMLEVGNNVFTIAEEQTHFSLWAIVKSPLIIGAALEDNTTSIATASLDILLNTDVIGFNQDSLGVAASFVRRWTDEYEIWSGPLSGSRVVVAVINWLDVATTLTVNFPDIGLQKAATVENIWGGTTSANVLTSYSATVAAHGTLLLELSGTTVAGKYVVGDAVTSGITTTFSSVYGATTSNNYTAVITFPSSAPATRTVTVNSISYTLAANALTLSVTLSLTASNSNSVVVISSITPSTLVITSPPSTLYPSTSFSLVGTSTRTTCSTGLCTPVGSKIGYLTSTGSASLTLTAPSTAIAGSKLTTVYFCNNDIAFSTSWTTGTNSRNMTISVNDVVTRIEVPLSGTSSELFSPGLGWEDTGTFEVLLPGWTTGSNTVIVGNVYGNVGLVEYGADFVALGVEW